jgi:hypothetical protein
MLTNPTPIETPAVAAKVYDKPLTSWPITQ